MVITNQVNVDLQRLGIAPVIPVVQEDTGSRNLEIALFTAGRAFTIPANAAVLIRYKKPDGTGGMYDTMPDGTKAWWIRGNLLTVALAPQVLTVPGMAEITVTLMEGGRKLSVFPIRISVQAASCASIADSASYFHVTGFLPAPESGRKGQYFRIAAVNEKGKVTAVEAVDAAAEGTVDQEAVEQMVESYLLENPPGAGTDGITPHIGANGNWYLGTTDTGMPSRGEIGAQGPKGEKGDTGAQGPQGQKGATGDQGPQGKPGTDGILKVSAQELTTMEQETLQQAYAEGFRFVAVDPGYTNLVPLSVNAEGAVYYGCGYANGKRLTSAGDLVAASWACVTGFMPYTFGAVLRIVGATGPVGSAGMYIAAYNEEFLLTGVQYMDALIENAGGSYHARKDGFWEAVIPTGGLEAESYRSCFQSAAYIRVSLNPCEGTNMIVTCDEEIPEV